MAVTLVQSKTYASSSAGTFHFVTFDTAPTVGNLIILTIVSNTVISGTPPSGGTGGSWSLAASAVDSTGTYLYYAIVSGSPTTEVDVTVNSADATCLQVFEYSGLLGASVLDKTATATGQGAGATISTGTTATTTQADELLFALVGITNGGSAVTPTNVTGWSNSFTQQFNTLTTNPSDNVRGVTASRIVAATATYTTSATIVLNSGLGHSGIIATFKAVAAAGIQPRPVGRFVGYPSLLAQ